jgi:hypothetical protein
MLAADHSETLGRELTDAGADVVLKMPYDLEQLVEVLGQYLVTAPDEDAEPLISENWSDVKMRPLILAYVERLEQQLGELGALLNDDEGRITAARMAAEMRGTAGGYGYPQISEAANNLHEALVGDTPLAALREHFAEISRLCASARQVQNHARAT